MCKGQLKVLHNLLPASSGVERGGGAGGLVPRGPGQLWGPGQAGFCSSFFFIGSQWEIQDFDKGGGPT